jgi:hypothetical protein
MPGWSTSNWFESSQPYVKLCKKTFFLNGSGAKYDRAFVSEKNCGLICGQRHKFTHTFLLARPFYKANIICIIVYEKI